MENQNQLTTILAIWGATIGTLTFIWNVLKWRQERPQISACLEAVESFSRENSYGGIRLKIRNRGGKKTTVENVIFHPRNVFGEFFARNFCQMSDWKHYVRETHLKTAVLPVVLDINGVWEGFIPLESNDEDNEEELRQVESCHLIAESLRRGKLRYSIICSHTNSQKTGLVRRVSF